MERAGVTQAKKPGCPVFQHYSVYFWMVGCGTRQLIDALYILFYANLICLFLSRKSKEPSSITTR